MLLLGITGLAGSGKTTLATMLVSLGWKRTAFASPIKEMVAALLRYQGASNDLITEMLNGKLKEVPSELLAGRSPRFAMQTLGTEWREMIDRNLWTHIWRSHIEHRYRPLSMHKILVDDLRFPHEEQIVREMGGKIVRIVRQLVINPTNVSGHASETEQSRLSPDITIFNDSTPDAMLSQLGTAMEYWK